MDNEETIVNTFEIPYDPKLVKDVVNQIKEAVSQVKLDFDKPVEPQKFTVEIVIDEG